MLTVLNMAFPLFEIGPDAVGDAEQIASALDRAVVGAGHRSIVLATAGSIAAGHLVPISAEPGRLDEAAMVLARQRFGSVLRALLTRTKVDVVHMHGADFDDYLPAPGLPVLVTLHFPRARYRADALKPQRPRTWFNAICQRQHDLLLPNERLLPPIENGAELIPATTHGRRSYALVLSRIAPEKGVHIALRAAHRAGLPMIVAGRVFPCEEDERHFTNEIKPLLDPLRRFIGQVGGDRKRKLLTAARCVVIPCRSGETIPLAAAESLAAGTPVVAFESAALADAIEDGITGCLVRDEASMAKAMVASIGLDRGRCHATAHQRFARETMQARYLDLYGRLADGAL